MHHHAFRRRITTALLISTLILVPACDNNEEPQPPTRISILSGNNQYSKNSTELPEPLRVKVQFADLSDAPEVMVRFRSLTGEGTASPSTDATDGRGVSSVRYTLGAAIGTQTIRAELVNDNSRYVDFTATAGEYYCPEEDPAYSYNFPSQGTIQRDLFLFTRFSSENTTDGVPIAGLVRLAFAEGTLRTSSVTKFEETTSRIVVHDASFSSSGDFYLARLDFFPEILRVMPNRSTRVFSALESFSGSEITRGVEGVLVGCDEYGPFVVGCRDTLQRFDEALYEGIPGDLTSNDAVAVDTDPQSPYFEDIYFIHLSNRTLLRLPVTGRAATGPTEVVAALTGDEAEGARGMVCAKSGDLYILVESSTVKAILKVTPAGVKTVEYDFFDRGAGNDAGIQNDLAIQRNNNLLYTIDTLNDQLLLYDIGQRVLSEFFPDTTLGYDPESVSVGYMWDERVGLVVLPGPSGF